MTHLLITLIGPTGSGKTELALRAAQRLDAEIVNCDSVQLYRHLEIGSAKPTPEQQRLVPHHLYSVIDPEDYYSAGRYRVEARRVCSEIARRGKVPLVVGGTGLYLRALLEGVFEAPGRSEALRERLNRIAGRRGASSLHRILRKKDPEAARRISPGDRVRVVRALEVYFLTGKPISRLQGPEAPPEYRQEALKGFSILKTGLNVPREILYGRITARVDRMFRLGLVEEVESLLKKGFSAKAKAFEALGYRHVIAFLRGELTLQEAIESTTRDTRRYAKRQMTWFRKEKDIYWIPFAGDDPRALEEFLAVAAEKHRHRGTETQS